MPQDRFAVLGLDRSEALSVPVIPVYIAVVSVLVARPPFRPQ